MSPLTAHSRLRHLGQAGLLAALLAMGLLFACTVPRFATRDNLLQILINVSVIGVVAVGEFFVIVGGGIDISVGKVTALIGVLAASLVASYGVPPSVAVVVALAAGAAVGAFNGTLAARFRVPAFIVTLGTFSMAEGLTLSWTRGASVPLGEPGWLALLGQGWVLGVVPVPVVIMLATFVGGWVLAAHTPFGRRLYATGGNAEAARLAGIHVRLHRLVSFVVAGGLAALGGLVLMSQISAGDPNAGKGLEFDAITAVVLGGTSLYGGEGRLFGVLVGALFMGTLSNGLTQWNVSSYHQNIIKGAVLIVAVLIDTVLRHHGRKGSL